MTTPEDKNLLDHPQLTAATSELAQLIHQCVKGAAQRCPIVGIAGGQGTGKSTLAALLQPALRERHGLRSVVLALDDYYLTRAERRELAAHVHPLLATRGVPGTHDLAALSGALGQLRAASPGESVPLYQFSKAHDDRAPEPREVVGPFDVVLFEGWCIGARPELAAELAAPINALESAEDHDGRFRRHVNAQLAGGYAQLWTALEILVFLAAPDVETVHVFRRQQELAGARALDTAQLRRFVEHFERVTRAMLRDAPEYADIVVQLDAARHLRFTKVLPGDELAQRQ